MKNTLTLLLFSAVCILIGSCNKGPTGGVPFYMKMDTAVVRNPAGLSASSNTQNIQDIWVQEGAYNIGAYELPVNFPVLDKDSVKFVVSPGIWQSGQSTNPVTYPLMNPEVFTIYAVPGQKYTHVPTFSYLPSVKFVFNEDFENDMQFNNNMTKSYDSAHYGHVCGKITVSPADSSVVAVQQAASGGNITPPGCPYTLTPGEEIWLEMDYKTEVPFWTGVIAHYSSGATDTIQILFLIPNSTNTWNKEYIKLSETVGQEGASTYNVYFEALNPSGTNGGSVYIDNVRLVHN